VGLQTVIRALFPPQCLLCETWVAQAGGLCPDCWRETEFLTGVLCDSCAAPLPGVGTDVTVQCDTCLSHPPPWRHGRAVMRYTGRGRHLVLALKHSDRTDIAPGAAKMMYRAAKDIVSGDSVFVPVPLHWMRLAKRRYNQSALLAQALARSAGAQVALGALHRPKRTRSLGGLSPDARAQELEAAIVVAQPQHIVGRHVILVDDVLTSGATLRACAQAMTQAGAAQVDVVVLARAAPQA